ncbi:MAG: DUF1697 domain-containing protein [Pseudomonadota bacterium]
MKTWIALLRGINVGGRTLLPMKDLRHLLDRAGFTQVKTYIQSGNCVFQSDQADPGELQRIISEAIETQFGFRPSVLLLDAAALQQAMAENPYPEAADDPKSVHLYFLSAPAIRPDLAGLKALQTATERFTLTERVLYLHAPEGIGRSKLAARVEQKLGVPTTARNFRTAVKISELLP